MKTSVQHKIKSNNALLDNLIRFMQAENVHEAALARETGIAQPTLHKILAGHTTDPRFSTLQLLANYFDTTVDALFEDQSLQRLHASHNSCSVPVISWKDVLSFSNQKTTAHWEERIITDAKPNQSLCALYSRPPMAPRFPHGTLFIVDVKAKLSDGDLVIVQFPKTEEATLREFLMDGRSQWLKSLGKNSGSEPLTKSVRILGVIVQSRYSY